MSKARDWPSYHAGRKDGYEQEREAVVALARREAVGAREIAKRQTANLPQGAADDDPHYIACMSESDALEAFATLVEDGKHLESGRRVESADFPEYGDPGQDGEI